MRERNPKTNGESVAREAENNRRKKAFLFIVHNNIGNAINRCFIRRSIRLNNFPSRSVALCALIARRYFPWIIIWHRVARASFAHRLIIVKRFIFRRSAATVAEDVWTETSFSLSNYTLWVIYSARTAAAAANEKSLIIIITIILVRRFIDQSISLRLDSDSASYPKRNKRTKGRRKRNRAKRESTFNVRRSISNYYEWMSDRLVALVAITLLFRALIIFLIIDSNWYARQKYW